MEEGEFGRDSKMIEDLLQECSSQNLDRLILGDLIKQKDVMMGLAKGQRLVSMGQRGSQTVKMLSSAFLLGIKVRYISYLMRCE